MSDALDLQIPSPTFGGSTGGWLRAAETEEKYAITWTSKKEQCLALGTQLRTLFKISDYKIYRIFPNSEVQYLHPKDGVFPEKLNEGRIGVGNIGHSIGKNAQPVNVKFTGKNTFD
jgi:photosystem I subunit 2